MACPEITKTVTASWKFQWNEPDRAVQRAQFSTAHFEHAASKGTLHTLTGEAFSAAAATAMM